MGGQQQEEYLPVSSFSEPSDDEERRRRKRKKKKKHKKRKHRDYDHEEDPRKRKKRKRHHRKSRHTDSPSSSSEDETDSKKHRKHRHKKKHKHSKRRSHRASSDASRETSENHDTPAPEGTEGLSDTINTLINQPEIDASDIILMMLKMYPESGREDLTGLLQLLDSGESVDVGGIEDINIRLLLTGLFQKIGIQSSSLDTEHNSESQLFSLSEGQRHSQTPLLQRYGHLLSSPSSASVPESQDTDDTKQDETKLRQFTDGDQKQPTESNDNLHTDDRDQDKREASKVKRKNMIGPQIPENPEEYDADESINNPFAEDFVGPRFSFGQVAKDGVNVQDYVAAEEKATEAKLEAQRREEENKPLQREEWMLSLPSRKSKSNKLFKGGARGFSRRNEGGTQKVDPSWTKVMGVANPSPAMQQSHNEVEASKQEKERSKQKKMSKEEKETQKLLERYNELYRSESLWEEHKKKKDKKKKKEPKKSKTEIKWREFDRERDLVKGTDPDQKLKNMSGNESLSDRFAPSRK
eukprot:gb/GECH01009927.1/.p1 GENE.gb/GECH01009927.1/~~gb/GECH01009927.1/.p1  ORF type:complete len:525 (+),score=143.80 gb/GECH01009927.1/:1-1575(+)